MLVCDRRALCRARTIVVEFIFEYPADTVSEVGERREATSTTNESTTEYLLDGYNDEGNNFDIGTGQTASVFSGRCDNNSNSTTNARVSIVLGSTSLTYIAYQPNPTQSESATQSPGQIMTYNHILSHQVKMQKQMVGLTLA